MDSRDFDRKMGDWYKSLDNNSLTATVREVVKKLSQTGLYSDKEVEETFTVPLNPDNFDEIEGGDGDEVNRKIDREDFVSDNDTEYDGRSDNPFDD